MKNPNELKLLSDDELLRRLAALLAQSRRVEADLVAHIGEVDARRLYAREACSSMFVYCRQVLHLSEAEAYLRIGVARAARQHAVLLDMLTDGRLHLAGIHLLIPHLTRENRDALLARATHKSKREIEELVAAMAPRPDVAASVRKLPQATRQPTAVTGVRGGGVSSPRGIGTASTAATSRRAAAEVEVEEVQLVPELVSTAFPQPDPAAQTSPTSVPRPAMVEPLAAERYLVKFTASASLRDKLERLQALMRDGNPGVDIAAVVEAAVTEKLERLEARRFAQVKSPRKTVAETNTSASSRYIPAAVRRAVYQRDGGRCRYVDPRGRRCTERANLEFHHHLEPFGRGGDHRPEGLRLMCVSHNVLLAEREYGEAKMARYRKPAPPDRVREAVTCPASTATALSSVGP